MCVYRPNRNKIILFSFILIQLCLIASYFFFYKPEVKEKLNKIAFLPRVFAPDMPDRRTYYTLKDTVNLKRITSRGFFLDFNSSMCFTEGTDIKTMIVIKGINWKCNCLEGKYIICIYLFVSLVIQWKKYRQIINIELKA